MPVLDPLDPPAVRVARRYEARLVAERVARELERRREGLAPVDEDADVTGSGLPPPSENVGDNITP